MENIKYIVTANHYSIAEGADGSVKGRILKRLQDAARANRIKNITADLNNPTGAPVPARIYQGSWIADCVDCGGAEFVSPNEPIFFCSNCLNRNNGSAARPVDFPEPEILKEIERLILDRPVNDIEGLREVDRANCAKPLIFVQMVDEKGGKTAVGIQRSWFPDETIEDLKAQNKHVDEWNAMSIDKKETIRKAGR